MTSFTRGNRIVWTTTPLEPDGSTATPASVLLSVTYPYRKSSANRPVTRRTQEVAMSPGVGGAWAATWDSAVAIVGSVTWRTQASDPSGADSGSFTLT